MDNKLFMTYTEPDKNTVICDRNPHPGSSIAAQCLNAHNYYRCLHGVQPLRYDKELEISAQAYANGVSTSSFLTHSRAGELSLGSFFLW